MQRHTLSIAETISYLNTLKKPKFNPKPNLCRQTIRIEHEKPQSFVSQSESNITVPKKTQTISARVEEPSRLSAPAEPSRLAIAYLNTWRVLHPPPRLISSHSYSLRLPQKLLMIKFKFFFITPPNEKEPKAKLLEINIHLLHLWEVRK